MSALGARVETHDTECVEGRWLLWRLLHDARDLADAKRLVGEQLRYALPGAQAAMVERVPLLRAVSEAVIPAR